MTKHYALILGASSGFGKAIAAGLAKSGVSIIGVHLDRATTMPDVEILISDLKSNNVDVHFYNVNAADAVKRADVISSIREIFSKEKDPELKVLVHSLAFGTLKPFISDDPKEMINQKQIEMTLDVMANSLVYWTQEIIKNDFMKRGGKIYAMTSSGGTRQIEFYGAVSAAKACLESYIRQLAMELGSRGISANSLRAGVTQTPALSKIPKSENIIANAIQRNPEHRLTTAEEVAEFVVDNYRNNSHWMTGNVIGLDGGESIVEL
ncbi:MAG TPA: SDR family oxidoreductase [Ignavibacteria bacterium]|nr:3-oxoacyl-ACP reductase [Bacteroidota bacterium]HRI85054.1 SDR family oxidoreductase [Ignavibacteria bacterium]HRJ99743.1 SDR family oxidoreductase [Ignavibacteria bacterium]